MIPPQNSVDTAYEQSFFLSLFCMKTRPTKWTWILAPKLTTGTTWRPSPPSTSRKCTRLVQPAGRKSKHCGLSLPRLCHRTTLGLIICDLFTYNLPTLIYFCKCELHIKISLFKQGVLVHVCIYWVDVTSSHASITFRGTCIFVGIPIILNSSYVMLHLLLFIEISLNF